MHTSLDDLVISDLRPHLGQQGHVIVKAWAERFPQVHKLQPGRGEHGEQRGHEAISMCIIWHATCINSGHVQMCIMGGITSIITCTGGMLAPRARAACVHPVHGPHACIPCTGGIIASRARAACLHHVHGQHACITCTGSIMHNEKASTLTINAANHGNASVALLKGSWPQMQVSELHDSGNVLFIHSFSHQHRLGTCHAICLQLLPEECHQL